MTQRKIAKEFDMLFKVTQKQFLDMKKMVYIVNETKEMRMDEVFSIQP